MGAPGAIAADTTPSRRKRRPNVTALIKSARNAGERGPVRVAAFAVAASTARSRPRNHLA